MRRMLSLMAVAVAFALGVGLPGGVPTAEAATLLARVELGKQRMHVYVDGVKRHTWTISSGRDGWATQPGSYQPFSMSPYYYSKKWKMSLPYLVSIGADGTAIHGTTYESKLGRPASHGCIRLAVKNAAVFYKLVESHGMWNTEVIVTK